MIKQESPYVQSIWRASVKATRCVNCLPLPLSAFTGCWTPRWGVPRQGRARCRPRPGLAGGPLPRPAPGQALTATAGPRSGSLHRPGGEEGGGQGKGPPQRPARGKEAGEHRSARAAGERASAAPPLRSLRRQVQGRHSRGRTRGRHCPCRRSSAPRPGSIPFSSAPYPEVASARPRLRVRAEGCGGGVPGGSARRHHGGGVGVLGPAEEDRGAHRVAD